MKLWTMLGGAVALLTTAGAQATGKTPPASAGPALALQDAVAMAASAVEAAERIGRSVSVVIVNREGRVILSQRMDGASFFSLEVAQGKATTSAALGAPTRLLEEGLVKGDQSVLSVPGVVAIAGGVPVTIDGKTVAAVGVSGSAPAEDESIAVAARERFSGTSAR